MLYIFQGVVEKTIQRISGEDIYEATPVPIPNTEVKLVIADNSKGMPLVKIGVCQIFFIFKRKCILEMYIFI